ncbi:uncharacterized protein si:ch211-180a12.2 isoform X2 [Trichomycterus rosablanca]|uniref:uncharacterized protein si:ch211-180a12.2 isoform X2 n=1 Tax=Trichomycterus rosablanca TaxID=2290929 RepID=UPI002F357505
MKIKVLFFCFVLGQIHVEIYVNLGSSTDLPCSFHSPTNDELISIAWSFRGSINTSNDYTNRSIVLPSNTLALEGSSSLMVYKATPYHQGSYECNVMTNVTSYSSKVTLTILAPPSISVPSTNVILGRESIIECWARGFSPANITFIWTRAGKELKTTEKFVTNLTADGLHEGLSQIVFVPKPEDRNTTYGCVVHHESLEKPLVQEFTLSITILPKVTVSVVPSSSRSSPLTLACEINGFYPQDLSVTWIQSDGVLPEYPQIRRNADGTYRTRRFRTLSTEERNRAGQVQCIAEQPEVFQPALSSINLSAADPLAQNLVLTKSAKASVAMMIISLLLVFLLCIGFSWKRKDEKQKSLSVSAIILPPRIVVGQKGRITVSIEGRRADQVQTAWFLNDTPILDTTYSGEKSYGSSYRCSKGLSSRMSSTSLSSEKGPLLASSAPGYYKLHSRQPLYSTGPIKHFLSSFTFIPILPVHKGAVFKCQISYKGKEKILMERVSEKLTVLSPPEVSEIQLSEPNKETGIVTMTIAASHFHPDVITFRWFCEGGELCPVAIPPALASPRPDAHGFFSAKSQCRLSQNELLRGETSVWVTVHHRALKQPITRKTRGFRKMPVMSEITSSSSPSASQQESINLACNITGFYPPEIKVKWLNRRKDEEKEIRNESSDEGTVELWGPIQTEPRVFRATAVLKDVKEGEEIVCRVEHCSLIESVEKVWRSSYVVSPSIAQSLSVTWRNNCVGVFSLCLNGGVPLPKLLWVAGGSTLTPLVSKEIQKVTDTGEMELLSICALVKCTGVQETEPNLQNHQNGHLQNSNKVENEAENETVVMMEIGQKYQETAEVTSGTQDEVTELEPSFVNTVYMKTEEGAADRECLSVTVEITHPALSLPVYRTWTES